MHDAREIGERRKKERNALQSSEDKESAHQDRINRNVDKTLLVDELTVIGVNE